MCALQLATAVTSEAVAVDEAVLASMMLMAANENHASHLLFL